MTRKFVLTGVLFVTTAGVGMPATSYGQENPDLSAFTCKQIMGSGESERDLAIALMHGYLLGKKGTTEFSTEALASASEEFIDHCLDNPTDKALDSLSQISK